MGRDEVETESLIGRRIVEVARIPSPTGESFDGYATGILLDNGVILAAIADEEGNRDGVLVGVGPEDDPFIVSYGDYT